MSTSSVTIGRGRERAGSASPSRGVWLGVLAIYLGLFLMQLDVSVVNVALNEIAGHLGGGGRLPWVIDGYTLPIASLMLTAGTVGDRIGHKRLYLAGLALFVAGTVGCAFAPSLDALIAARVVQGIGAAPLAPASLALLVRSASDRAAQQRLVGRWAAIGGLGFIAGPIVGGSLTSAFGWPSVFAVTAVAGVLAFVAAVRIHEAPVRDRRPVDVPGIVAGSFVLAMLVTWFIEGPDRSWTSGPATWCLVLALLGTLAFWSVERRVPAPMLPLRVFRSVSFVSLNLATVLMTFGNLGFFYVFGLRLQQEEALSPFAAGVRLLPMAIALVIASTLAHHLVKRIGGAATATIGFAGEGIALAVLLVLGNGASYGAILPILVVLGTGTGIELSSLVAIGVRMLAPADAGLASAIINTARQVGTALGVALLGSLYGIGGWATFQTATLGAIAGFGIGALLLFRMVVQRSRPLVAATAEQDRPPLSRS